MAEAFRDFGLSASLKWLGRGLLAALLMLVALPALAGTVTLVWDPVVTAPVTGYKIHYGTSSGTYTTKIDVGNVTSSTVPNLTAGGTYYFAVTAYDATLKESGFSNQVVRTVSTSAPVAQFSASSTFGFAPLTVNFASTSAGSITGYAWTFGDGTSSVMANPSKVYSAAGTYSVTLKVTGPGGSNTLTRKNYVVAVAMPNPGLYRKQAAGSTAPSRYMLDYNFDHLVDATMPFGAPGDVPLVGNINPGGKSSLIVYRNGVWYIDTNRNGAADVVVGFGGLPGDVPLTANFSGAGALDDLVIYRAGTWYVDRGLNGVADQIYRFGGMTGDVPLAADVNGDGIADLGIYRKGTWYVDTNRDGIVDMIFGFGGGAGDVPVLFDWDGDGKADLCIFRDGIWYISTKRNGVAQVVFGFGSKGDVPFLGRFN